MITARQIQTEVSFTFFSTSPKYIKLSAAEQRSIFFGHYIFGKKSLKVKSYGIDTMVRVAYGQDYDIQSYTWEEIARMINENKKA